MSAPSSRRQFLGQSVALGLGATWWSSQPLFAQDRPQALLGDRPERAAGVTIELPRTRVPLSFIIDDSTCLVNLAHFAIPQFVEVYPERYLQPWKTLPREIPDSFVRKFAEWCHGHGVRGKYSIVPHPACVGWVDRGMPGWSARELRDSLQVVRDVILPDWDIHPEMVSHTFVIDTKTGRPYPEKTEYFLENSRWTDGKSVDEIANYLAYALRILKNADLPCEGITTPGGFGNRVLPELAQGTRDAVKDVYGAEIPHYFRHLFTDGRSVAPRVEYARGLKTANPECVVSIIGCTGDWFGGWDGLEIGHVDQFITEDARGGRLPEVIAKREPAVLVCHWPGIYCNGHETGFRIFQEVVRRLEATYDDLVWMKNSELARYWAAKELTGSTSTAEGVQFQAPFACPAFTVRLHKSILMGQPVVTRGDQRFVLKEVANRRQLVAGTWCRDGADVVACWDLVKGVNLLSGMAGA